MSSATSTSSILSIPRSAPASSNAAIRLLAQVYLSGQSLEITEADGSEVRAWAADCREVAAAGTAVRQLTTPHWHLSATAQLDDGPERT